MRRITFAGIHAGGKVDGMQVLARIRRRWPDTAVIILTAYASLDSALAAIRRQVDGYLEKPATPSEIRQVVREVLDRRGDSPQPEDNAGRPRSLQRGGFSLDLDQHLATVDGRPVELTPREFALLDYLMQHSPRVISPRELVRAVQDYDCDDDREAREIIKWYIHRLRRKVESNSAKPRHILNVRGVGYTLSLP